MDIPRVSLFFGHRECNNEQAGHELECLYLTSPISHPFSDTSLPSDSWEMKLKDIVKLVFEKRRGEGPYYFIIHEWPNELR